MDRESIMVRAGVGAGGGGEEFVRSRRSGSGRLPFARQAVVGVGAPLIAANFEVALALCSLSPLAGRGSG
jgi:hypothetical protein